MKVKVERHSIVIGTVLIKILFNSGYIISVGDIVRFLQEGEDAESGAHSILCQR